MITGSTDAVVKWWFCTSQRNVPGEQIQVLVRCCFAGRSAQCLLICTGEFFCLFVPPDDAAHSVFDSSVSGFICVKTADQQVPFLYRIAYDFHELSTINRNRNNLTILGCDDVRGLSCVLHFWFWRAFHHFYNQTISGVAHSDPCKFVHRGTKGMFTVRKVDSRNPTPPLHTAVLQDGFDF